MVRYTIFMLFWFEVMLICTADSLMWMSNVDTTLHKPSSFELIFKIAPKNWTFHQWEKKHLNQFVYFDLFPFACCRNVEINKFKGRPSFICRHLFNLFVLGSYILFPLSCFVMVYDIDSPLFCIMFDSIF